MRVVGLVALAGYLLALGATPTGHGLRLTAHLLAEHGEAHDEAHAHDEEHEHGEAHAHDEARDTGASEPVHAHDGRLHSHREEPPPPAIVALALDKHCLFESSGVPAPAPARTADPVSPGAIHAPVVVPVEMRPPQRAA